MSVFVGESFDVFAIVASVISSQSKLTGIAYHKVMYHRMLYMAYNVEDIPRLHC